MQLKLLALSVMMVITLAACQQQTPTPQAQTTVTALRPTTPVTGGITTPATTPGTPATTLGTPATTPLTLARTPGTAVVVTTTIDIFGSDQVARDYFLALGNDAPAAARALQAPQLRARTTLTELVTTTQAIRTLTVTAVTTVSVTADRATHQVQLQVTPVSDRAPGNFTAGPNTRLVTLVRQPDGWRIEDITMPGPATGTVTPTRGIATPLAPGAVASPTIGAATPARGATTPATGATIPAGGGTTPTTGALPTIGGITTPTPGTTIPTVGITTPVTGGTTPTVGGIDSPAIPTPSPTVR